MKYHKTTAYLPVFTVLALLLLTSCVTKKETPVIQDPRIVELLAVLEKQNESLKTFSGQGSIAITESTRTRSYRLAWAAQSPERIRLVVLFSGKPIETLAADGQHLYLKSHTGGHVPIKRQRKNPSLEPFIAVPLTTGQITCFLSGKIPVPDYKNVRIETHDNGKGSILRFYKDETSVIQTVSFDENKKITGYDVMESRNTRYAITLGSAGDGGYVFPKDIKIVQNERSCLIQVDSTTPNPDLPQETFVIVP